MCDQTPFLQGRSRFNIHACAMHVTSACTAIHFKTVQMIIPRQYVHGNWCMHILICVFSCVYRTHSGGHLFTITPCQVYYTQQWSPAHHARNTAHSGGHLFTVTPCQVYCTQRRSPVHSNTMAGIPHTAAVTCSQ